VGILRRSLCLIWACLGALTAPAFAEETRLALVIDQTNYQNANELSRVAQAGYEADLIESALRDTGFRVTRVRDRTKTQLIDALDDFRIRLEQAGPEAVGFVYYTGHGAQHPGSRNSYLLGIDARLRATSDLASYGIDLEAQRDGFAATGAKAVFLVFDACRNVATGSGFKANMKGMSRIEADADMLIAYSTDLDDVAQEGIYAPVLAEEIRRQGQPAETLFANVQKRVAKATGFRQKPWFSPRLYKPVCFASCQAQAVDAAPILANEEGTALAQAISADTLAAYAAFHDQFPNSSNLVFVNAKIAELTRSSAAFENGVTPGAVRFDYDAAFALDDRNPSDYDYYDLRKVKDVLVFSGILPDMTVIELEASGGLYTELFSKVVGENGKVFMQNPSVFDSFLGGADTQRVDGRLSNVTIAKTPFDNLSFADDSSADIVTWFLGPHELWYTPEGAEPGSLGAPETAFVEITRTLKPGGHLVVLDHMAPPGAPATTGGDTHRIDKAIIIDMASASGLTLVEESDVLAHPEDDHTTNIFDPAIRRKTDRFLLKFEKP
jgi:predicted methyltransferase/uncharacterized caspase-like protein